MERNFKLVHKNAIDKRKFKHEEMELSAAEAALVLAVILNADDYHELIGKLMELFFYEDGTPTTSTFDIMIGSKVTKLMQGKTILYEIQRLSD